MVLSTDCEEEREKCSDRGDSKEAVEEDIFHTSKESSLWSTGRITPFFHGQLRPLQ